MGWQAQQNKYKTVLTKKFTMATRWEYTPDVMAVHPSVHIHSQVQSGPMLLLSPKFGQFLWILHGLAGALSTFALAIFLRNWLLSMFIACSVWFSPNTEPKVSVVLWLSQTLLLLATSLRRKWISFTICLIRTWSWCLLKYYWWCWIWYV